MSKNPLRKLTFKNKSNSLKIIEKKKVLLNTFQNENQNNNGKKYKKKQINNYISNNKEINLDLENKENIQIQNTKENMNKTNDINYYFIQKNKNNKYNIKTLEKIDNLGYYKQKNRNLLYSKVIPKNNKNFTLKIQNNDNNKLNYDMKKTIKKLDIINNTFNSSECFLTDRFPSHFNNKQIQQFTQKSNELNPLNNKPLTEREYNNNLNHTYNNNNLSLKNNYLLPKNKTGKKTLILDLDETLIHSSFKPFNIKDDFIIEYNSNIISQNNLNNQYIIHVLKRPYVGIFLSIVCDIFEVVIFTASVQDYANPILDQIDSEKKIKYRLFRDHCIKVDKDKYIKNLYCLGRDLKNVIIIDNNPLSYTLNIENGLPISTWETNQSDNELIKLMPILQYLSRNDISDVRPIIKRIVKNNNINYDEVNKIMNLHNCNYTLKDNERKKSNNNDINKKSNKEIYEKCDVKIPKNDKSIYKKLEYNNHEICYFNNSISNNQNILKNIFVNREHQMFIKKLKHAHKNRGKSENQKPKKVDVFEEKEENSNTLFNQSKIFNLSEKYLINKNEYKQKDTITNINKNNKAKNSKTFIENKKKEISIPIPIPTNNSQIIPIYKNNSIVKNKVYSKNPSRIYFNKNNSKKLIKNHSDFNHNINNNNMTNEQNFNIVNTMKYPTLKKLLYQRLFYNKYYNNKKESKNAPLNTNITSRNKNKVITTDNKQQKKLIFNFKRNIINFKDNKNQNYSFEKNLNNKFNLTVLDNHLNKFLSRYKMNIQKKTINESKENDINNNGNRTLKENNSCKINKNKFNLFDVSKSLQDFRADNPIMKHSFSFLNNNRKIKDYISIINGYRRSNKKIV